MSEESTAQIEQAAGDWLARRDARAASPEEQQEFEAWLNRSVLHRVAYLRLKNVWNDAQRLRALGAGIRSDLPPPPQSWNLSPFFKRHDRADNRIPRWWARQPPRTRRALFASCALALVTVAALSQWPLGKSYETPVGGIASVPMADGSQVTLNTNSEIDVAMSETERLVDLKQGEAFFEVAKDPQRPFVVRVGDRRVVAVGTKFSVRRDMHSRHGDIQVIVTEGVVRLESVNKHDVENAAVHRLAAGGVARVNRDGLIIQRKPVSETEEQLSWRSGVLVFRDVTLMEAAEEFNRYTERKIRIADPRVGELLIAGSFRTTNVDALLRLLEQGYPIRVHSDGEEITLSAR